MSQERDFSTEHVGIDASSPVLSLESVIAKVDRGDGLTDEELIFALDFYQSMHDGLKALGPHYFFPMNETGSVLRRLREYESVRIGSFKIFPN